jgi:hypothetical protein
MFRGVFDHKTDMGEVAVKISIHRDVAGLHVGLKNRFIAIVREDTCKVANVDRRSPTSEY